MFFYASKIIWFFLTPSNLIFATLLLGAVLSLRWRRLGGMLVLIGVLGLGVFGLSPAANLIIQPLEERFPQPSAEEIASVDAIIILGGFTSNPISTDRGTPALTEAADRIFAAAELARRVPDVPIILTGGSPALFRETAREADIGAKLMVDIGIDPARIVREDKARNTAENASETRKLIDPQPGQRFLLVTSAYHMPRSFGAFRADGWTGIVPYPTDYRTRGPSDLAKPFAAVSEGLRRTDISVREWIGLAAYWITGRSAQPFPGPEDGSASR